MKLCECGCGLPVTSSDPNARFVNYHYSKTEEGRQQISVLFKGKKKTKEHSQNIGNANKGKKRTEEWKQEQSQRITLLWQNPEFRKSHTGDKNYGWIADRSLVDSPYPDEFYVQAPLARQRDNYTCQRCGITEDELGRALDVHHIDDDKENNEQSNLLSLCHSCHSIREVEDRKRRMITPLSNGEPPRRDYG